MQAAGIDTRTTLLGPPLPFSIPHPISNDISPFTPLPNIILISIDHCYAIPLGIASEPPPLVADDCIAAEDNPSKGKITVLSYIAAEAAAVAAEAAASLVWVESLCSQPTPIF